MNYYPPLTSLNVGMLRDLRVVSSNIQENPNYLESLDCPYTPDICLHLTELFKHHQIQPEPELTADAVSHAEFDPIQECVETLVELQMIKRATKNLSTSEKIQTFKMISAQLEKLTEVKRTLERLEEYQQFKTILFETLDRHLSPAQIGEFLTDFEDTAKNAVHQSL